MHGACTCTSRHGEGQQDEGSDALVPPSWPRVAVVSPFAMRRRIESQYPDVSEVSLDFAATRLGHAPLTLKRRRGVSFPRRHVCQNVDGQCTNTSCFMLDAPSFAQPCAYSSPMLRCLLDVSSRLLVLITSCRCFRYRPVRPYLDTHFHLPLMAATAVTVNVC